MTKAAEVVYNPQLLKNKNNFIPLTPMTTRLFQEENLKNLKHSLTLGIVYYILCEIKYFKQFSPKIEYAFLSRETEGLAL